MPWRAQDQRGVTPQNRGRFPGYDVLGEVRRWDDVTAGVVLARLAPVTDLSFFTKDENACAGTLCDLLLAQDGTPKIPVVALVDSRLALGETDGWHYDDLPEDGQAWRDTLAFLDEDARAAGAESFALASTDEQTRILQHVQDLGSDPWHGMPASQVWSLWTRYACAAFYSHPWSWNEIGFGGPAYPRGYKARHVGPTGRERWEVADRTDSDPVPFANRVEQARRAHAGDEQTGSQQ